MPYKFPELGIEAKNIEELEGVLSKVTHEEIKNHFFKGGNYFTAWIESIGAKELSKELMKLEHKNDVLTAIRHYLLINKLNKTTITKETKTKETKKETRKKQRTSKKVLEFNEYKEKMIKDLIKKVSPPVKKKIRSFKRKERR